ncbi:MAG TPA: UDP-N-acetylmuramate--L-alanine ligase [Bacteroidia bacterium]|nr:UDP-N-acetylmuramate--L-alanine ligase [Bacteroidia bacterium]
MELEKINNIYLIGIGGIGMSALARFFNANGKKIAGYDKTPTTLTDELMNENMNIHFEDNLNLIPQNFKDLSEKDRTLIIYTPAIPAEFSELSWFRKNNYTVVKRSEVLGLITKKSFTIAVGGTHGKTTTSSIITHLLKQGGVDCTAFLGGIAKNYDSNLVLGETSEENSKPVMVVEADEFDRSFLTLFPDIAVVTSMDADHLDIYHDKKSLEDSYKTFVSQVKKEGVAIYKAGLDLETQNQKQYTYSINSPADFKGENISVKNNKYTFDFTGKDIRFKGLTLGLPGRHNVENAVAAIAVALQMNVTPEKLSSGLSSYDGVKRRFDFHIRSPQITFIDDYAHHPEELRATILSVKELYPEKKVTGIFQPHLYSRTRDFADDFAESLSLLDELILLDIYPAREKPIAGVDSKLILDKVSLQKKTICSKNNILKELQNHVAEVVITLGAGDIDQLVDPIKKALLKKYKL